VAGLFCSSRPWGNEFENSLLWLHLQTSSQQMGSDYNVCFVFDSLHVSFGHFTITCISCAFTMFYLHVRLDTDTFITCTSSRVLVRLSRPLWTQLSGA
jgi:hypothetical protein